MSSPEPDAPAGRLVAARSRREFLKTTGAMALSGGALSTLLAACGSDDSGDSSKSAPAVTKDQVAAATGSVGVLTFSFYEAPELNAGKVKAKYSSLGSADEIVAKVKSKASRLEVVNSGANIMSPLYAVDRLEAIPTDALANYPRLEQSLVGNPIFSQDGKLYAIPFAVSPGLTAWDSKKVPEPTSADDLLKPEYKGKIGLRDSTETLLTVHRMLGGDLAKMSTDDLDAAVAYLGKLKGNIKTLYPFGQEVDLFGRGDIAVAVITFGSLISGARKANEAVKANFLGSLSYVDSWSIAKGTDLPRALSWIDNSISPEGQKALQKASGGYPAAGDDTDTALLPDELRDVSLADFLQKGPVNPGVPVEGDGLATITSLDAAWNDFKSGL